MTRLLLLLAFPAVALAACRPQPTSEGPAASATESPAPVPSAPSSPPPHAPPGDRAPPAPRPLAADLTRAEWRKAENRGGCAPLVLTTDGGARATARRAEFAGGWAIAFDTLEVRSAYGVAGPGLIEVDQAPPAAQAERLGAQWPHFTTFAALPAPAFAGYGVEGASPYPPDNPDGRGVNSLAYVRVGGERCTYNVWSRLGRAHLEVLLGSLRKL